VSQVSTASVGDGPCLSLWPVAVAVWAYIAAEFGQDFGANSSFFVNLDFFQPNLFNYKIIKDKKVNFSVQRDEIWIFRRVLAGVRVS